VTQETILLEGEAGAIEVFVELPKPKPVKGFALIGHPHPLFGGNADNKVVTTLARAFRDMGCATLRPNFRGVGASAGEHADGSGETVDLLLVHDYARQRFGAAPFYLAGFSFGAYVITRLAKSLADAGDPAQRMVLVGTAAGHVEGARRYETTAVAADTIVIHGGRDDLVPLQNVFDWAEPMDLPVIVIPGADHFFHRRLHIIRAIIARNFGSSPEAAG
jgi:alpha/beta superfamily hydrolase